MAVRIIDLLGGNSILVREPGRSLHLHKILRGHFTKPTGYRISFDALDDSLMLRDIPGTYCAGEMLDWEAPTGGDLPTACLATARCAGRAAALAL